MANKVKIQAEDWGKIFTAYVIDNQYADIK